MVVSYIRYKKQNVIKNQKESQMSSAEEKAALAQLNLEEKRIKEQRLIEDLKKYIEPDET